MIDIKPVFAINVTENKNNDVSNAEEFLCQRISQVNKESLDKVSEENNDVLKKASLPLPLKVLMYASMIVSIICLRVYLNLKFDGMSAGELWNKAPALFIAFGVSVVILFTVLFFGKKKREKVLNSEENEIVSSRVDVVCRNIYAELGVEEQTPEVDVFDFKYKVKKNGLTFVADKMSQANVMNYPYKFYVSDDCLYLVSLEAKYRIPLTKTKGILKVNKRAVIPKFMWNKDVPFNSEYYKQFKIGCNDNYILIKPYYILCFEHNGEEWGIYFPSYELPVFEKLTGLKAE